MSCLKEDQLTTQFRSVALWTALGALSLLPTASNAQAGDGRPTNTTPVSISAGDGDYLVGPDYTPAPELTRRDGVPQGKVIRFTMASTDSKIYSGIAKNAPGQVVPYFRRVSVYVPPGYQEGKREPFFISQDSMGGGQIPTMLDNMIADKRVPAMVGIFIDSGGGDAQGSERGLEYDTVSGQYAEFVESEVLPRVEKEASVLLTKDPRARMTMGGSSGGACAFTMAWYHPELYHRVLTYSGTYVNQESPTHPDHPHGAWTYHEKFIPQSRVKPLRIWMEVGENDNRSHDEEATLHNWVMANNRMAAALKAKGYHYQYVFARGAGHVDGRAVQQTLPEAFEYVGKDYPGKR